MTSRYLSCLVTGLSSLFLCNSLFAQTDAFDTLPGQQIQQSEDETAPNRPQVPQQSVEVNEERAGWQAAGIGLSRGRLSDKLRANWVMVDANGLLRGTVLSFDGTAVVDVTVRLLRDGQVVNSTRVNQQGQFSFNNVQQGTYGLVGFGDKNFFAFGFDAIRNSDNPKAVAPESITVMATPNDTTINTDCISYFGPDVRYRVYGRFTSREGTDDPAALYGTSGISLHYPEGVPATSIQSHAVTALSDGRLIGRVHQIDSLNGRPVDVRNTRIMLLQNDDVYAATSSDNFGVFEFSKIKPGFYSLVAAGADGLAAIGVEVVESRAADGLPGGGENADAQIVPIDISLIPSESTGWLLSFANEAAYQRALNASARFSAQRGGCNCPPNAGAYNQAVIQALQPSSRGRFWKRLNGYFDNVFYGPQAQQGAGYQGAGYQGAGYQGNGYQGNGYQGNGYQGNGYQGNGYQGNGYQGGYGPAVYPGQPYPGQRVPNQIAPPMPLPVVLPPGVKVTGGAPVPPVSTVSRGSQTRARVR